jgi:hypothetical protein
VDKSEEKTPCTGRTKNCATSGLLCVPRGRWHNPRFVTLARLEHLGRHNCGNCARALLISPESIASALHNESQRMPQTQHCIIGSTHRLPAPAACPPTVGRKPFSFALLASLLTDTRSHVDTTQARAPACTLALVCVCVCARAHSIISNPAHFVHVPTTPSTALCLSRCPLGLF